MTNYYAVRKGRKPGIYRSWDECKMEVTGFKGAEYKKFDNRQEAESFILDKEMGINVSELTKDQAIFYVDGSYNITTKEFSYGIVMLEDVRESYYNEKFQDPELSEQRNVAGEVYGAMKAMEMGLMAKKKKIYIFFDYKGIRAWALGEWKRNIKLTQDYKAYYDSIKNDIEVEFVKVKAHSNDKYNDMADRLAKDALGIK